MSICVHMNVKLWRQRHENERQTKPKVNENYKRIRAESLNCSRTENGKKTLIKEPNGKIKICKTCIFV